MPVINTPGVTKAIEAEANQPAPQPEPSIEGSDPEFWGGEVEIQGLEPLPEGESYKEVPPIKDWINSLPVAARKTLKNMQADYTKKTQEVARLKRELEQERKTLKDDRDYLTQQLDSLSQQKFQEFSDDELYEPQNFRKFMEQESIKNYKKIYESQNERWQKMQQDEQYQSTLKSAQEFVASKSEFKDEGFKKQVYELLEKANKNADGSWRDALSLEDAYIFVKAKQPAPQPEKELEKFISKSNLDKKRKEILQKTSTKSPKDLPELNLKGLSGPEKYQVIAEYKERYGRLPRK